jgi:hypothetical protein
MLIHNLQARTANILSEIEKTPDIELNTVRFRNNLILLCNLPKNLDSLKVAFLYI